jgi:hypothetical protein
MGYWPNRDAGDSFERFKKNQPKPETSAPVAPVGGVTVADVQPLEPWERQPEETGPAWAAFQIYRDLGPERSIVLTRKTMKADADVKGEGGTLAKENGKLQKWALKYNWVARALAFDKMIDKKRVEEHVEQSLEMTRRHIKVAMLIQKRGIARLLKMKKEDILKMKPIDAAKLIDQGVDMERLARGQSTSQSRQVRVTQLDGEVEGQVLEEVRDSRKALMDKLAEIEKKRSGTQQMIDDHEKTPNETPITDGAGGKSIRQSLLPHLQHPKEHQVS